MKTFGIVASAMNFSYTVQTPQTGVRFGGVISDLKAGLADFGVSHIFVTYVRIVLAHLSYTSPINTDHYSFIVQNYYRKSFLR